MSHYKERIEALSELRSVIETLDLRNDDEFRKVFQEARMLLEMTDRDLADALSTSRPSVNRWANGKNLPHFALRKSIIRWIGEQLAAKVKVLVTANRAVAARAFSSYSGSVAAVPLAAKSRY
jgi:DNA-binding XRE family transcriptional regulator